jgi:hypothetical protein
MRALITLGCVPFEAPERSVVEPVLERTSVAPHVGIGPPSVGPERLRFGAHARGVTRPPVVEDPRLRTRDGEPPARSGRCTRRRTPERLRVAHGAHADPVADESNLRAIPSLPALHVPVVAEEVQVVEQHALHATVFEQLLASRADDGMIVLVQDFVRLQVQTPVAVARVERHVREIRIREVQARLVPCGVDDPDARIADRLDQAARVVPRVAGGDRNHELVDDRKGGEQRLPQGIVEGDRVAGEREARDAHACFPRGQSSSSLGGSLVSFTPSATPVPMPTPIAMAVSSATKGSTATNGAARTVAPTPVQSPSAGFSTMVV